MDKIKIFNAKIITPFRTIPNGYILMSEGRIEEIGYGDISTPEYMTIDAKGNFTSPGFVDIHTHGGGGHDFMDLTAESFLAAARIHCEHGTTSILPTTLASSKDQLDKTFEVYEEAKKDKSGRADFLGLHLEGPYFSMEQKGAQDPKYIRDPDPVEYLNILEETDSIRRWSAAPELKGGLEFGRELKKRGILPAIAHSDAIYEQVVEAYENGYTHMTHLYSGMSGVRRINAFRYAGVIESAYIIDEMTVEIIADGVHLPSPLLKMIYKIKGPDKIALVTDSMRAAGMPEGESILGGLEKGQKVIVEDGVAKLPDRTAFAGSVATADRLVRTMMSLAGVSLENAIRMITITPARIMSIDSNVGSLVKGKDADVVIFDDNINVLMTIVKGRLVYENRRGK